MNRLQSVEGLMERDAVRAVQAREVYLKRGLSVRVHRSALGAISVTHVDECGRATRTWPHDGEEEFETEAISVRTAELEELGRDFEARAAAVLSSIAEVMRSPGHGGVTLEDLWLESGRSIEALGSSDGFRGTQSLERWSCVVSVRTIGTGVGRLGWFEAEGVGLLPNDPVDSS